MASIKQQVLDANRKIVEMGLVSLTWGNVSFRNTSTGRIYIKPSGVNLQDLLPSEISCTRLDGTLISGKKPSVDLPTHLELYRECPEINSVIHTHSKYATIFAQSSRSIPCLGTTHADYFFGNIPCISHPNANAVREEYEKNTGASIIKFYKANNISYNDMAACLIDGHGPFVWGTSIKVSVERAHVLELVAEMAHKTLLLNPDAFLEVFITKKHFLRKHGNKSYYGQ